MKILLVQSWLGGHEPPVYPLGLACLAAGLKGHEPLCFDPNVSSEPLSELARLTREFAPELIGVSLRNIDSTNKRKIIYYYSYFKQMLKLLRENSGAPLAVGGAGFSMFAERIMQDEPLIDFGIYLEGEQVLPKLAANLDNPAEVPALFYRENGAVRFSGKAARLGGAEIVSPDYGAFPLEPYLQIPDSVGVETKRGCALTCLYCPYPFLNGAAYRLKEPARVVDEIEYLYREKGLREFSFVDSVFNIPRPHAEDICREIIRRGLKLTWSAWFNEREITVEFVMLARAAGCVKFILSPDGFTRATLEKLGKNIKLADIERSFEILSAQDGFEVCYNFFKNPPGQSLAGFLRLVRFFVAAKRRMGPRVHFEFNSIRVEPHTRLHKLALNEGVARPEDDLLAPLYYTQKSTAYIEKLFNLALRLKGK